MARGLQDLLVPDVEPGRDIPDGLRHRQPGAILRYQFGQVDRRARRQEAMVVVDKIHIAVVDALVIGHMRIGGVDAHRLGDDLGERPALARQLVISLARALLVARQDAILQLLVERLGFGRVADRGLDVVGHRSGTPILDRTAFGRVSTV